MQFYICALNFNSRAVSWILIFIAVTSTFDMAYCEIIYRKILQNSNKAPFMGS